MPFGIISDALIVLVVALLVGELFEHFRLPSVAGELLSGIVIGPAVLGIISVTASISAVSSVALFFIIFYIGFEMNTQMVRKKIFTGSMLSVTSFLVPLGLTSGAALLLLPFGSQANLIVALAIAVPSISIISVLVLEYKLLQTDAGQAILASVTVSDVVALIVLAGLTRSLESTLMVVVETLIFIVAFVAVDWVLNRKPEAFQNLLGRISKVFIREDFAFGLLIIVALAIAVFFQTIGLSYILGSFFAGLIVHDGLIGRQAFSRVSQTLSMMNRVFFIPLFFGFAGLEVSLLGVSSVMYVVLAVLILIAMIAGVALTYYVLKRSQSRIKLPPKMVAAILGGRGAVGIIIATVALDEGVLNSTGFSLVVLATLAMSLAVPFLIGKMQKQQ